MEQFAYMIDGFAIALQPMNLVYVIVGCLLGTIVGILPGLGPTAGIALLIPLTYGMDPTSAIIMLAGIYYGSQYGGSTTAILINTPGEASSVMTTLDGYQMAKSGRAGAALAVAAIGSFIAGTIAVLLLSLLAVPLSSFALRVGPAEYFAILLFAMASVSSLTGKSVPRAVLSMLIGLVIATIGIDLQSGLPRYTGAIPELQDGVGFIVAAVGLFAVTEVICGLESHLRSEYKVIAIKGRLWLTWEEWKRSWAPILRGTFIGFIKGVTPGGGSTVSTILSYTLERGLSPHREKFGTGMIEGVAGPEAANNASATGAFVPLLTLGVPGSGATAVLLGAFIINGVMPGPLLLKNNPEVVWGLIDSMYLGNLVLFLLNLPLIFLFVRLLYIPVGILFPLIIAIASIGVFAIQGSTFELYLTLGFGVLGYIMRKLNIPTAPLILSLVLGGLIEQSLRQAMTISGGSLSIFVNSQISLVFIILSVLIFFAPMVVTAVNRRRARVAA